MLPQEVEELAEPDDLLLRVQYAVVLVRIAMRDTTDHPIERR